jgi:Zn-dependent alcohol dehydrogenase
MDRIIERIYKGQVYECLGTKIVSFKNGDHVVDVWKSRCAECGNYFEFYKVQEDHKNWSQYMSRRCQLHKKKGVPVKNSYDIQRHAEIGQ